MTQPKHVSFPHIPGAPPVYRPNNANATQLKPIASRGVPIPPAVYRPASIHGQLRLPAAQTRTSAAQLSAPPVYRPQVGFRTGHPKPGRGVWRVKHPLASSVYGTQSPSAVLLKAPHMPALVQRSTPIRVVNKGAYALRPALVNARIRIVGGAAGRGVVQRIQIQGTKIGQLHGEMMKVEAYQKLVKDADSQGEVTIKEGSLPYSIAGTDWAQRLIVIDPDHDDSEIAHCIIFELLNAQDTEFPNIFNTSESSEEFAQRAVEQEWTHAKKFQEVAHAVNYMTGINPGFFPSQTLSHKLPKKDEYVKHSTDIGHMKAMGQTFEKYLSLKKN
jgi:hypothetical protein